MILLRCVSFLIGGLIVTGAPFFLLPDAPQRGSDMGTVLGACALVALLASGFFFVGIAGNRMKQSRRLRALGALLLAMPIVGGIAALFLAETPPELWMIGPLLCFASFLFFAFVYPAKRSRSYRAMRPREQPAPASTTIKA